MSFRDLRQSAGINLMEASPKSGATASTSRERKGHNPLAHFKRASSQPRLEPAIPKPSPRVQKEEFLNKVPIRGVRPRYHNVVNPITAKPLLPQNSTNDDDISVASSLSGIDDLEEDQEPLPTLSTPNRSVNSRYAGLNQEIVNFQKMVSDLEDVIQKSGDSPEAQWRTRILTNSSRDAERDISRRLYEFEAPFGGQEGDSRGKMALRKLRRDFSRVHKQFATVMENYEKRQHAEVSFLSAKDESKEEFFDRAMREREQEISNIHSSMNKVNAIYGDLAGLVEGQQDQIDQLAEKVEESKATTIEGMEHIHESVMGMCGPHNHGDQKKADVWSMQDVMLDFATSCQANISLCATDIQDQYR